VHWTCAFTLLVAFVAPGCDRGAPPGGVALTREEPSQQTVAGVQFVELFERDANNTSPLLVGLHGRGDTAEGFAPVWRNFPAKLEIALALAPLPYAGGREWFDWPPGMSDDAFAEGVSAAEMKLWPAIAELAHGRKILVTGFSQGAVLTYLMAVRHPDAIAGAFPIAGRMPGKLLPRGDVRTAPVYALHGTGDNRIDIEAAREAIAAFKAVGATAELHEFDGVGHTITPAMRDDLVTHVLAAIGNLSPVSR
jgi:phospholipase/carboxylesterase